jgi:hypothetical protein
MLSVRRHRRGTKSLENDGWGPPHPPPRPLVAGAPNRSQPGRGSTNRRRRRGSRATRSSGTRTVALLSAAAIGAAVLVFLAALTTGLPSSPRSSISREPSSRPHPVTTALPAQGAHSALDTVNNVIRQTAAGRQTVIATINSVQACTVRPDEAQAAISQVVVHRQQARSTLLTLVENATTAPVDRSVVQSLIAVIDDSIQADQNYEAWIGDVASASQPCGSQVSSDPNLAEGQAFSAKADSDKRIFLRSWNPLAGSAGLATYSPQDF